MNRNFPRTVAVLAVSLAILALVGYLAYERIASDRVRPIGQSDLVSDSGRIQVGLDDSALVPADLPMPDGAAVRESFDLATDDGDLQGTRTYDSDRALEDEVAAYDAYLEQHDWKELDRQESAGYQAVLAERQGRQILAAFAARPSGTRVTITVVASPARY